MTDYPKYIRLALDVEVEVTDSVAARAFTFDTTADGGMLEQEPDWHIGQLVMQLLGEQLTQRVAETGVKLTSSSVVPRFVADDGSYMEFTLPPMPRRLDDGSMVWPDGTDTEG